MESSASRSSRIARKLTAAIFFWLVFTLPFLAQSQNSNDENRRPRARDVGVKVGILPTGALNAITDVPGVAVGHTTIVRGDNVRTGVTAVLPHLGNLFRERVPGAVFVGNGFGKLAGSNSSKRIGRDSKADLHDLNTRVPRVAEPSWISSSCKMVMRMCSPSSPGRRNNEGYLKRHSRSACNHADVLNASSAKQGA